VSQLITSANENEKKRTIKKSELLVAAKEPNL
jgi:hypothetical protein